MIVRLLLLLLLPIIKMLQILMRIVRGHVHAPIPFSLYVAVRFAAVAAARCRYRAP